MSRSDPEGESGAPKPLSGIRVLDAGHVLAGPFATYQLALLGADVVRVERIGGDDFVRHHGGTPEMRALGLGASFLSQNANKASVALNLKDRRGAEVFRRMAAQSDVVMENFRPGVMNRLGLGFDELRRCSDRIVYCSLTGYGREGPLSGAPAYDHVLQGISGLMSMTGTPQSGPMRVGFPIVDYIAGLNAAFAITAALHQRNATGAAQRVSVSMLDSVVAMMTAFALDYQTTGALRGLSGNQAFSNSPFSDRFETRDGFVVITANTPAQARRLCEEIGAPGLTAHVDAVERGEVLSEWARQEIADAVRRALLQDSAEAWETRFGAVSVPAGKVRNLAEIMAHPQLTGGSLLNRLPVPEIGATLDVPGLAFHSDEWEIGSLEPAPTFGRDSRCQLRALGLSDEEIETMAREGVVAGPDLPAVDAVLSCDAEQAR